MISPAAHLPDLERASEPPLHTVFGLDPVQLHARYWASFGVQVVRVGEPSEVVGDAELYLLLDPRSLPVFHLEPVMDTLNWVEPAVLTLRLRDARERGYREVVVTGGDGGGNGGGGSGGESGGDDRFIRFHRIYGDHDERMARVALTPEREIAKLWQQAGDPLNGWRRIRRFVPRQERVARSVEATVYDRTDDHDVALLLQRLVAEWRRPHATIRRAVPQATDANRPNRAEVWADPSAELDGARLIGRVWVGAGRKLRAGQTVVGPAVIWDDTDARPSEFDVGDISWPALEPEAAPELDDEEARALRAARRANRASRREELAKRGFDIAFSAFALLITFPLWPLILLGIWLTDGRPFFFGHTRQSRGGRPFKCWKFRSMYNNAEEMKQQLIAEGRNEADGAQFYMENDPRITRIGKILRKTNLDELPQFWNVIVGDMSVVGPRPSPDKENQFNPAWREARLSVRPGITGLWQIRRTRAEGTDFQEWIRYDIEYVETRSFWGDLGLIGRTITMILRKIARS